MGWAQPEETNDDEQDQGGPHRRMLSSAAFVFAACSSGSGGATTAPASMAPESMAPESMAPESMAPESMAPSPAAMDRAVRHRCAGFPADGAGSFDGMALDPVATAASNNPALSTLVTAVGAAGLAETLNTTPDITVFAPTNDAFTALDKATLDAAMADPKGLLTTVLTYHVVPGRISPDSSRGPHDAPGRHDRRRPAAARTSR